jgi:flavin reductase (DIM6/NTAB) family NADH-FMN oxidoreductase RutF
VPNELDVQIKKQVLRLFTYGMYAVTTQADQVNDVFLANWLSQCSFDPPLIMVSIQNDSRALSLIRSSGFLTVHVLASGQREFAGMLGKSSRSRPDKLKHVRWHPSPITHCPILDDTLGYIECRLVGELPAGDSTIVVSEIIHVEMLSDGELEPLTMEETGFRHAG